MRLGDTYGLSEQHRKTLGEEVGLVILGINPLSKLRQRLQNRLQTHNDVAAKIAASVEEYIPADIKLMIKNLPEPETLLNQTKNVGQTNTDGIPVPPPPGSQDADAPTPNYGGTSDPYREPTE